MRDRLARLDDALIERGFQPFVDLVANHLPLDCFRLAGLCTDLSALAWILSQADAARAITLSAQAGPSMFRVVLLLLGLGAIVTLRTLFQQAGSSGRLQSNPLRPGTYVHRLTSLLWLVALALKTTLTPLGFESMALFAVGLCATAALYIGACSNRPPRQVDISDRRFARVSIGMKS